ncbi:carbohydrate ABC transporter permease [Paenibacillus alba]|uniref:Sugar ABC transporter permease n=1 Tax=Paenibacillus alba TaxID=1197127 RepID=A0ABU6GE97_9BACL|nr:sugar ABC transporter permease [Paenibacillus alba]MEC0232549.1 sugar ABC transporter permease [Paenibacillus alba]
MDISKSSAEPWPSRMHQLEQKKKKISRFRNNYLPAYLLVAPTVLLVSFFYVIPVIISILLSFVKSESFGLTNKWVGLENYRRLVEDKQFWGDLWNTFHYVILFVPSVLVASTVLALLLNQKIKGISIFRTIYFLPQITLPAATALVWVVLFNKDYGLINHLLGTDIGWLSDSRTVMLAFVTTSVWGSIGLKMVIILAGLQGIPTSLYEAGSLEGANAMQKFWHITLPLLTPTLFFVAIISVIEGTQVFDGILFLVGKNSIVLDDVRSLVFSYYINTYTMDDPNYGSAIIDVLLVINLILTAIQFRLSKKWVFYE